MKRKRISNEDKQAIASACSTLAQRAVNAENRFIESVVDQFGFSEEEARTVLTAFSRFRLHILDPVGGVYRLKECWAWDRQVMENAIALSKGVLKTQET